MITSLHQLFPDVLGRVYELSTALAPEAMAFFLLSIFLNRKSLIQVLSRCFPENLKVNYLSYIFDALLVAPLLGLLVALMQRESSDHAGTTLSASHISTLPSWCVFLLILLVGDLIGYFRHRLEHARAFWPVHSMHHSDRALNWFSLYRIHPLNRLTTAAIDLGLLVFLGFPVWSLLAYLMVRHYYGLMIHANVPWTFGFAGRFFVSPAMHRWHHVRQGEGVGKNFAIMFSIYDQLFGTYYVPGPCEQPLGTLRDDHASFWKQLCNPIEQWLAILRADDALSTKRADP